MDKKTEIFDRRSFLKVAGIACAGVAGAATLSACGAPAASPSSSAASASSPSGDPFEGGSTNATEATIGYWGGSPCELPVYVAIMQNYFQAAGIKPNIVKITSDTSILLANDEIDCFMATPGDFPALYNGENMKLLDTIHIGCWSGVALSDEIKNCADLTGKTVGTSMINGPAYVEVNALCDRQGGDSSKINWVQYQGSLLQEALTNGEVDAACGSDSSTYPIKANTNAHFFYISAQELGEYFCCFIGANANTLAAKPELGDKLAVAFAKAIDYIKEDPVRAIDESMENGYASDKYPEIQQQLSKNYMFNHGNKSDMLKSVKERWQELYDSGLLTQAPAEASEVSGYLDSLVDMVVEWHGDAAGAAETADKAGTIANLAERGSAYVN
ncbi:MAG: ABC transporter substrate-binding protein [Coriobacteriales bacterium]|jgi:ABC-type nitrate/sulfonate/bicarbonate transport system substrate-binding protein|nr:ABC transporter substrate-binding protein [Coriobacteriales bacterium]